MSERGGGRVVQGMVGGVMAGNRGEQQWKRMTMAK